MILVLCLSCHVRLGTGTFAEVKKAIEVSTGVVRAIKVSLHCSVACTKTDEFPQCITKHKFANNPKTLQLFQREVSILESLDHVSLSADETT